MKANIIKAPFNETGDRNLQWIKFIKRQIGNEIWDEENSLNVKQEIEICNEENLSNVNNEADEYRQKETAVATTNAKIKLMNDDLDDEVIV